MKNAAITTAFTVAIVNASSRFPDAPRSTKATATVTPSSTRRIAKTPTYTVRDSMCCDIALIASIDKIQQREQEDPDDIHEVPVQSCHFDGKVVLPCETSLPVQKTKYRHHCNADQHVEGVHSGHHEIEPEEDLHFRTRVGLKGEMRPGNQMFMILVHVFHSLDGEERRSDRHRQQQKHSR